MKNLVFCSGYNMRLLFYFRMQGAWHSPNTLPITIQGQAFPTNPNREGSPYSPSGDAPIIFVGFSPWNLHQYSVFIRDIYNVLD